MKEDLIVRIIGKAMLEYPQLDQKLLRRILEEVLYDYSIASASRELAVKSDMVDRIHIFLVSKKMDGLSDNTLKNYSRRLHRFANHVQMDVKKVDIMDIRQFLAELMKTGIKNSTLETEKSVLKSFFGWLEAEDYIIKSPTRKLKPTKLEKRDTKALTVEELEMLREACITSRQRALLEFMFSTGGRLSEITQINISAIDWNSNSVRVIGKGNKERTIFFSPKAKIYLRKYLMERKIKEEDALFIGIHKPYARLGNRSVQREIKAIAQRAGIENKVHPHILRHTMATLGYKSGMPLPVVQELLGHNSIDTTQRYAVLDKETVEYEYMKHLTQ